MNSTPLSLGLVVAGILSLPVYGFLDSAKKSQTYILSVIATLLDGRASVGLTGKDGVLRILHQNEHTRPCRVLEVRSGEADLDCGLGVRTYGIGDVVDVGGS